MKFKVFAVFLLLIVCFTFIVPFASASELYPMIDYAYIETVTSGSSSEISYILNSTTSNISFVPRDGVEKFTRSSVTGYDNAYYLADYYGNVRFPVNSTSAITLSRTGTTNAFSSLDKIKIVLDKPAQILLIFANDSDFDLYNSLGVAQRYSTLSHNYLLSLTVPGIQFRGYAEEIFYQTLDLSAGTYYITRTSNSAVRFISCFIAYDYTIIEQPKIEYDYYLIRPNGNVLSNNSPFQYTSSLPFSSSIAYPLENFTVDFGNWPLIDFNSSIPADDEDFLYFFVDEEYSSFFFNSTYILVGTDIAGTVNGLEYPVFEVKTGPVPFYTDYAYNDSGVRLQYTYFDGQMLQKYPYAYGYYLNIRPSTTDFEFYALYIYTPFVDFDFDAQYYYDEGYNYAKNSVIYNSSSYIQGRLDGIESASNYTFLDLFSAIIDAPIRAVFGYTTVENGVVVERPGLLTFEVFGVDLSNFVLSIFSIAVVLCIIRIIRGG